jgi:hypothetical protein
MKTTWGFSYLIITLISVASFLSCSKPQESYITKQPEELQKMANASINEKVKRIVPGKTTREQVIEAFGKPDRYAWEGETFSEDDLPDRIARGGSYVMVYEDVGVNFAASDKVWEVRVESNKDYSYEGKIRLGSSVEDVISFFGEPSETVTGEPINWHTNKVLCKDVEGKIGRCYIHYRDIGIRMFFVDYKVRAFYMRIPDTTP